MGVGFLGCCLVWPSSTISNALRLSSQGNHTLPPDLSTYRQLLVCLRGFLVFNKKPLVISVSPSSMVFASFAGVDSKSGLRTGLLATKLGDVSRGKFNVKLGDISLGELYVG
jgi:hypothetical protein